MKKLFVALISLTSLNTFAATQNLTIEGTISSICSFTQVNNGIFGYDVAVPFTLDTAVTGGTPASASINYNATPTITVTEVTSFSGTPSGFTDTVVFTNYLTSFNGGNLSFNGNLSTYTQTSGNTDTFTLRVKVVNSNGSFPIGTYRVGTVITCQ